VGDYASGKDTGIIDVLLIGNVNKNYLTELIEKAETLVQRKIRHLVLTEIELIQYKVQYTGQILLLWSKLK
jgi:hypothetical protein